MVVNIANPIYDSVFKYLMEDERIARTLISALLRKEVVEVEMRRNEYTNGNRDNISMFRIDFGAKVREDDGSVKLVLIELQKTWVETETLRFRQYLGAQYSNPDNMFKKDTVKDYAIPMVAVYLLGHKVGDIEEPVLYVDHKAYDYYGNVVTTGLPDPFVDSLTHNSIIVQIPRLKPTGNTRLDEFLSFFDQRQKRGDNNQVLEVDEDKYYGDAEMQHVLHRLLTAAADAKLRQDMNVEDEYFKAIEDRDTAIMLRDEKIASQDEKIASQDEKIASQSEQLASKDKQLASKDKQLASKDEEIAKLQKEKDAFHNKMISVARMMKASGMSEKEIAQTTNISIDELTDL